MKFVGPARVVEAEHRALALDSPFEELVSTSHDGVAASPRA